MNPLEGVPNGSKKCLFCLRRDVRFDTVEHIIPESLGNTEDVLVGIVCNTCQNYLAREVEKPALEKTPIAFWRTFLGTTTKRGKLPSVNLTPPTGGRLPAMHALTDAIGFTSHNDGSTSVDIDDPALAQEISDNGRTQFLLVLAPFHLCVLGRFLGKIGLELLAKDSSGLALDGRYDALRRFVREGTTSNLWALYRGTQGNLDDFCTRSIAGSEIIEEHECYRYSFGEVNRGGHMLAFGIGTDLWVISLTDRLPVSEFESCVEGVPLTCVFYPDGSW